MQSVEASIQSTTVVAKIASGFLSDLRAMLLEQGLWAKVREALARRSTTSLSALEEPTAGGWVDLRVYVDLLEATSDVIYLDGMRALGRSFFYLEKKRGFIGTVLRSWMRSFGPNPGLWFRVTPLTWRALFRGAGHIEIESAGKSVVMRGCDVPIVMTQSRAWQLLSEGMCEAALELVGVQGHAQFFPSEKNPSNYEMRIAWS